MSQQTINVGAAPNDGTGTPLRTAFQYTNSNFTELYTALGGGSGLPGASSQVIFNDGGTNLAGSAGLVFNKTTSVLGVGTVNAGAAIVSGDLTVDTSTLKVDSANNRVGVGTASPISQFANTNTTDTITGTVTDGFAWRSLSNDWAAAIISRPASGNAYALRAHTGGATASDYPLSLSAGASTGNTVFTVTGNGIFTFGDGAGGTRMTLDSTGLGVGVSPSYKLDVLSSGVIAQFLRDLTVDTGIQLQADNSGSIIKCIGNQGLRFNVSSADAMTLDASGNLLVGTTTANGRVAVDADLTTYNGMSVKNTVATYGSSAFFVRFINSSGATAGSIQHTAVTTTNYSTTSDARLKESKGISTDTSVIDNTVVHDFVWKADGSTDRGVFAQEAHSVKPRAVSVGSDELTDDGNIKTPWSVDYSKFVPDLIVYCQQLKKQVVELTARVQTLETR